MAVFNNPTNVNSGNNLTASLWNDQLGGNGSVKYLYDTQNDIILKALSRNVILRKSTNTVISLGGNADIAFDTLYQVYSIDYLNYPLIAFPFTAVQFPTSGMYLATFSMRTNVASTIKVTFTCNNGVNIVPQQNQIAYPANANVISTAILSSDSAGSAVTINVQSSVAVTLTAAAPTTVLDGNMMLKIVRLN